MRDLFIIARSGWPYVTATLLALLFFLFLDIDFFAFVSLGLLLFVLYVFRNPERELNTFEEAAILSPVDGVVSVIEELEDEAFAYRIDILSSYTDVSLLRLPINATVVERSIQRGARLSIGSTHRELNENASLLLADAQNNRVKIIHRLSRSFAPLFIEVKEGQNLPKSARYGTMLSGMTSLYLPKNVRINVNPSSEVKASQTLIGYFS